MKDWSHKLDLNQQPIAYKAIALPIELLWQVGEELTQKE